MWSLACVTYEAATGRKLFDVAGSTAAASTTLAAGAVTTLSGIFGTVVSDSGTLSVSGNATLASGLTQAYNNSSGNWRFDNITISGVAAAPEPSSWALALVVALAFVGLRRASRRTA